MKIFSTATDTEITLKLSGCLDTDAAPEFAAALDNAAGAKTLVIDFSDLEFIASSGLRALVLAKKHATQTGNAIVLTGMNDVVADVFDVTGLKDVFDIR